MSVLDCDPRLSDVFQSLTPQERAAALKALQQMHSDLLKKESSNQQNQTNDINVVKPSFVLAGLTPQEFLAKEKDCVHFVRNDLVTGNNFEKYQRRVQSWVKRLESGELGMGRKYRFKEEFLSKGRTRDKLRLISPGSSNSTNGQKPGALYRAVNTQGCIDAIASQAIVGGWITQEAQDNVIPAFTETDADKLFSLFDSMSDEEMEKRWEAVFNSTAFPGLIKPEEGDVRQRSHQQSIMRRDAQRSFTDESCRTRVIQLHNLIHSFNLDYHQGCAFLSLFLATFTDLEDVCKLVWFLGSTDMKNYFATKALGVGADSVVLYELCKLHLPHVVQHLEVVGKMGRDSFIMFSQKWFFGGLHFFPYSMIFEYLELMLDIGASRANLGFGLVWMDYLADKIMECTSTTEINGLLKNDHPKDQCKGHPELFKLQRCHAAYNNNSQAPDSSDSDVSDDIALWESLFNKVRNEVDLDALIPKSSSSSSSDSVDYRDFDHYREVIGKQYLEIVAARDQRFKDLTDEVSDIEFSDDEEEGQE